MFRIIEYLTWFQCVGGYFTTLSAQRLALDMRLRQLSHCISEGIHEIMPTRAASRNDRRLQTPAGQRIENRIYSRNETLHAPHLLDLEVTQVLRRLVHQRTVPVHHADEAFHDPLDLRITRYAHLVLLPRIWQQRHNFSVYDAAYIALAVKLGAALVTCDGRLASASGHAAAIELF